MTRKKVIPVDGKSIPLADGNGNLPEKGKTVTLNSYWHRLETDGDVTFAEPDEEPEPTEEPVLADSGAAAAAGTGARTKK